MTEEREVRLEDYAPPPYLVDSIDLDFDLAGDECLVTSTLSVRRAPQTPADTPLVLDGTDLEPDGVALDGRTLSPNEYGLDAGRLVVPASLVGRVGERKEGAGPEPAPSAPFALTIRTRIFPGRNTTLKGLYESNGILCTQCEAEDFRRITFYPDRPDVLARYTTTIRASRANFPVLLSNGNLVASGPLEDGRHFARWVDPFPKPCYLFALVAGDLACREDGFTTASGREVALRIYSEPHNIGHCGHAMESLKKAMRWDEEVYGLEYDLDLYMIVAVDHFNMGAMENKGLNVFNSRYVLADPATATDLDYADVEAVIGHEYFHNWTGNRVTCRDWFQLSLKEGLTVFRDQQFSAAMGSPAVKRIRDARLLRDRQFKEDSGPDAHPVRPDAYEEINNFYTLTIYWKGAEIIRMMHVLLGPEGFRRGLRRYLERHDGAAATTDDFLSAMEDGGGIDLGQFRRWYSQAGTPILHLEDSYDPQARRWSLRVRQELRATADGSPKEPVHLPLAAGLVGPDRGRAAASPTAPVPLPLAVGLVGRDGRVLAPSSSSPRVAFGGEPSAGDGTVVLEVRAPNERFVLDGIDAPPVASVLRGFSAPVRIEMERPDEDLLTLLAHDPDPYARWDAGQSLALARLDRLIAGGGRPPAGGEAADPAFAGAMRAVLRDRAIDGGLAAEILTLPSEGYLADRMKRIDVDAIHRARKALGRALGQTLAPDLDEARGRLGAREPYRYHPQGAARRALANVCLGYLAASGTPAARRECLNQLHASDNMTDTMAALKCLADIECEEREEALAAFETRFGDNPLAMDKWLAVQAQSSLAGALDRVVELRAHPAFDGTNPNRLRALVLSFCDGNQVHFHAADGSGYRFWADRMREIDPLIPELAARLAGVMAHWRRHDDLRRERMGSAMESVLTMPKVSRNTNEVLTRILKPAG